MFNRLRGRNRVDYEDGHEHGGGGKRREELRDWIIERLSDLGIE